MSSGRSRCTQSSGRSDEPVRERGHGDRLDVVRRHVRAAVERGAAARELQQRQRAARARADLDAARRARRRDEVDHVEPDAPRDVHLLDRLLHLEQLLAADDRLQLDLVGGALEPARKHVPLLLALGVADADPQQEAVELRLGQRVGALVLDRVLRRQDEERPRQRVRRALDRDLPLLHRLEQRRLRLRWGAVDLVGEEKVGEDRARPELEVGLALVVDRGAGHVGGHQVGRELDAREADARHLREGAGHQRLGQAREVLDQDVAVGEDPEQHELERLALADDRALDLVEDGVRAAGELVDVHSDSSRSTSAAQVGRGDPGACRSVGAGRSSRASSQSSGPSSVLARLEAQPAGGEADADDLAHDRPQAERGCRRRDAFAIVSSRSSRSSSAGRWVSGGSRSSASASAERPSSGKASRAAITTCSTRQRADDQDEDVELELEPARLEQPREQQRGREQRGQEEPGAEQPPHAAARAARARRARRAGRRERRSRPPSSSRRSRGG